MSEEMVRVVTRRCWVCGGKGEVVARKEGVDLWLSGMYVQEALPELSADQREMLISGTHPECWDVMWDEDQIVDSDEEKEGTDAYRAPVGH